MLVDKLKCDAPGCPVEFDRPKGSEKYQKHTCSTKCFADLLISIAKECQKEISITCAPLNNGDVGKYGLSLPIGKTEKDKGDIS